MGEIKQTEVRQTSKNKKIKANGKAPEDQLVDEVKKLDQIRDMLFGEHVASLQDRYQSLDKNLDQNIAELRTDLSSSVKELKQQIEDKFEKLHKQLLSEQSDRLTQNNDIQESLSTAHADILTKIDLEVKKMDDSLNQQQDEATRQLNEMMDSLQTAKVDREMLAELFSQIAKQLKN